MQQAIQFLAVSFCQIIYNSVRLERGYRASVGPRPTRRKTIQIPVAGDVASIRSAAFWYGQAKSDASIWRTTTGAIYNSEYHRTATWAPRLSPTRFIRMVFCGSDKTLFVMLQSECSLSKRMVIVGVGVLFLSMVTHSWFSRDRQNDHAGDTEVRRRPISTRAQLGVGGSISSDRLTYCVGNYAVSEFGNLRIAVKGRPFSGVSTGWLSLSNDFTDPAERGSSGSGNRKFEWRTIQGGCRCQFAGLDFTVISGVLHIADREIQVDSSPKVIIFADDGRIEAVLPIQQLKDPA